MEKVYNILLINMGATSTKVSIFSNEKLTIEKTIRNTDEEMAAAPTMGQQLALRKAQILAALEEEKVSLQDIDASVVRIKVPRECKESGTYELTKDLMNEIYTSFYDPDAKFFHGVRLAAPLLKELIGDRDIPVYMVDPASVDEMSDLARISGHPLMPRSSNFHALNQKAVARAAAKALGKEYKDANLVVAHMGGGVSVGAHEKGRVVDCSNAGNGMDGPFSTNRAGSIPSVPLMNLCFSGKYTQEEVQDMLMTKGGFIAYLGTGDVRTVEQRKNDGDTKAALILDAFIYQVSKEIAAQCAVLGCNKVDGIVLTGGIAYSKYVVSEISKRLEGLAPILPYPGEEEAPAMVAGALRVLRGEEEPIKI